MVALVTQARYTAIIKRHVVTYGCRRHYALVGYDTLSHQAQQLLGCCRIVVTAQSPSINTRDVYHRAITRMAKVRRYEDDEGERDITIIVIGVHIGIDEASAGRFGWCSFIYWLPRQWRRCPVCRIAATAIIIEH